MDREKKKCGGFRRITGGVVSLLTIIALLTACSGSSDDSGLDKEQSLQENPVTEEQEKETDTNDVAMQQDGVADGYEMMSVQAPTDQIISDYHEKGYDSVWLTSHEVNKEDGEVGEIGTTDTVNMQVTYADPNGYYQITEEIGAIYAYWGPEMGWKNNFDAGTLVSCDITGFNGTRWKLISDSDIGYEGYNFERATSLIGSDTMSQYDIDSSKVSIYFALENFDIFTVEIEDANYFNKVRFYDDPYEQNEIGTVTVVVDGDVYSTPLRLKGASGDSYHSNLLIAEGASFYFDCAERYDECYVAYSANGESDITPISSEEYEVALQGQVQEIETSTSERENDEDTYNAGNEFDMARVNDTYYINGTDEGCYEIYFYVEDGAILFSVYRDGIDLIRQADAVIVDGKTLHFDGYDDWNIDFVWNEETSFWVDGTGEEIADMIGTEFFSM